MTATRFALFLGLLGFLAGCDTPDLRNVVFKPPVEDPEAYKNALRAYFVTTAERPQPWGNEFLSRLELSLGRDEQPLPNLAVRLDGLVTRTDRKGYLALDRLRPGYHALEVPAGGEPHRFTIPIEKGRMTLCIFESAPGLPPGAPEHPASAARSVASYTVLPHAFLLAGPFRELSEMHHQLQLFLDALEGRPDELAFASAIATDYVDRSGGRGDLLKARRFLAGTGHGPSLRILRASAGVVPGHADVALLYSTDGHLGLARLILASGESETKGPARAGPNTALAPPAEHGPSSPLPHFVPATSESPWRLVRVLGMNPFETPEERLAAGPALPALPPLPRRKDKTSGLGVGLTGTRGSFFNPDESGVVERDPFSVPVDRAQPDLSQPGSRVEPGAAAAQAAFPDTPGSTPLPAAR